MCQERMNCLSMKELERGKTNMAYKALTEIFATKERQEVLDMFGIKYAVDTELNFCFENEENKKRAIKVLEDALEL